MSQLRLRQADGSFREILMIKGDKGDKGDTGNASESINDNLNDIEHTWSSSKISTELAAKTNDADLVIDTVAANETISSLLHKVQIGKTKKFQYTNANGTTDLPSDYPVIMLNANCIFRPTVTVNRITEGIMYLEVISANQSTGVPKILTGYYNGTLYWNNELSITNVVNNLLTTTDGFVLDARQGKALKDNIDTINNNLQLIDFTGTTLDYSHVNGMSMLELPSIPNKNIVAIYPCIRTDGLTYNGLFVNDWGSCFALLTDGTNKSINSTEVSIKILAL